MYYADFLNDGGKSQVAVITKTESTVTILHNGKERRQAVSTNYGQYFDTRMEAKIRILELLNLN